MTKRTQPRVVSPAGERDTRLVAAFRLASVVSTGAVIVAVGRVAEGAGAATVVAAVGFSCVAGSLVFAERSYGGRAARAEERRLRADLLRRWFASPATPESPAAIGASGEGGSAAGVIQMMTDNTERLTEYRQVYLGSTLAALATPFVVLGYVAAFVDPVVGFGVMSLVPVIPVLIGGFLRFFRRTSATSRHQRAQLAGRYLDAIRNLVTIRLLGAGERIESELRVQGEANRGAIMRLLAGNQIVIVVTDGLFGLVLVCLSAGLVVVRADHMTTAQVTSTILLTVLLLEPLQQVAGFFYIGMGGMASQRALRAFLGSDSGGSGRPRGGGPSRRVTTPQVTGRNGSGPDPVGGPDRGGRQREDRSPEGAPSPAIEVLDVHFDYGRGPVLDGVDLQVPIGSRVAVIGRSGAGKSTLMGLLRGALPLQRGHIRIAGREVSADDPAAVRALSATVAQRTWMFTGTIAENLRVARADATDDELWEALEGANIADEVARMPNGLQTHLGEGAMLVSGGQAQRISLARALLSGRRVLLLDEPTGQIDVDSESRIIDAIAGLPDDRTVLMVTHRHSLLRIADDVHELVDGRLLTRERARG